MDRTNIIVHYDKVAWHNATDDEWEAVCT